MRELLRSPRITAALFYFQFCPFFYHGFWSSAVTRTCKAVVTASWWLVSLWNLPLMSDNGSHKRNHCTLFNVCTVHNFSNIKKNIKWGIFHIASTQFFSSNPILTGVFIAIRFNVIINTVGSNRTNKMVAYLLFGPFFPLIWVNQVCFRIPSYLQYWLNSMSFTFWWLLRVDTMHPRQYTCISIMRNAYTEHKISSVLPLLSSLLFSRTLHVLNPTSFKENLVYPNFSYISTFPFQMIFLLSKEFTVSCGAGLLVINSSLWFEKSFSLIFSPIFSEYIIKLTDHHLAL